MSNWLRRRPLVNYFRSHHLCMDPANVLGLKLPQCIAALKDSKLPFKIGERTEFHIKLTTNREGSIRKTRYSRRPILGFRATRRVDRGLLEFLVFLWALGTPVSRLQRSRQNFQPPNLWQNSLGFRLHHSSVLSLGGGLGVQLLLVVCVAWVRVEKIEGWKRCSNWGGRSKSGLVVYIYILPFLFFFLGQLMCRVFWRVGWVFLGIFAEFFLPTECCISAWYTEAVILIDLQMKHFDADDYF